MRKSTDFVLRAIVIALLFTCAGTAVAQSLSHDEVTASYLYNFAKDVSWPNEPELTRLTIGIYRPINAVFNSRLKKHLNKVKVRGLPIRVVEVSSTRELAKVQLLLIEEENNALVEDLFDDLSEHPILLVTNNYANQQLVMINLITTEDNRMQFEVNKANMIVQGLTVKPSIILNGGSEIDVAKLFREGQASLIKVQQKLRSREDKLNQLEKGVNDLARENDRLNLNLATVQKDINTSQKIISEQKQLINSQKITLRDTETARKQLEQAVAEQTEQLRKRQTLLDHIGETISQREARLDTLNQSLLNQKTRILELDDRIATQDMVVNYLIALVVLGVILVIVAAWAYINQRHNAQRLEAHSKDLQIARDRLALAKIKAEEANQAKSDFLSLMSHELRTPLQAIIGYADVVIEELQMEGLDHYTSDLNRVIKNSQRLLGLINNVLDLAKIEAGRMELDLTQVDLVALTEDAIEYIRPQCELKGVALSVASNNGATMPVVDKEKLLHIILNLLSNAVKFTDSGKIAIVSEHLENKLLITVEDTGTGIPPDQVNHIFERFQQVDSSETRRHQGSGLGLAICKQFCELMGGGISVSSVLQKGSTFTIEIPLPISDDNL